MASGLPPHPLLDWADGRREYGEAWHDDGKLHKKQNVFDDFIAAAEYLVHANITRCAWSRQRGPGCSCGRPRLTRRSSRLVRPVRTHPRARPSRIIINGGSNGGLLVGAAITHRPDLFGAAIADVGCVCGEIRVVPRPQPVLLTQPTRSNRTGSRLACPAAQRAGHAAFPQVYDWPCMVCVWGCPRSRSGSKSGPHCKAGPDRG